MHTIFLQSLGLLCTEHRAIAIHTHIHTYIRTVEADWKRWNLMWRLKVDRVSIERMCAGKEFQVEGAEGVITWTLVVK